MYRAAAFTARDLFDLALVATRDPVALLRIRDVLAARRKVLLARLTQHETALREDFAALDVLDFRPSYDECVDLVLSALAQLALLTTRRLEQECATYRAPRPLRSPYGTFGRRQEAQVRLKWAAP